MLDDNWIDDGFVAVGENATTTRKPTTRNSAWATRARAYRPCNSACGNWAIIRGDISGVFDTLTEQAVQLFELSYGTMQTGIATVSLQEMLYADTASAYSSQAYAEAINGNYTELQLGASGSNVLALQYRLRELGYPITHITRLLRPGNRRGRIPVL